MSARARPWPAEPQAGCHQVERAFANRTALVTALFTHLGTCVRGLSATLPAFFARPRLDLGFYARACPFRTCASSLVESRWSETCWPCDSL